MSKSLRSPQHIALLQALKNARLEAGITQTQLAEDLGKPQSYVAKIEGGERRLDVVEFANYTVALHADAAVIIEAIIQTKRS